LPSASASRRRLFVNTTREERQRDSATGSPSRTTYQ
jgi:hypothetical protein